MKNTKETIISRKFEEWVKVNNPKPPYYAFTLYFTDEQNKELNDVISNEDIESRELEYELQESNGEIRWGVYPYRDELCVVACGLDMDFSDFSKPFQEKMIELIEGIISKPITDVYKKWCNQ